MSSPDMWSEDQLLAKARVYAERASLAERDSGLEQLWSLLALELLARAAIAHVHPALLADPTDGVHLLYAFGFGEPKPPRSVPIATVFRRCQVIIPTFTEQHLKDAIALMALRNEELHTGSLVLEELRPSAWQPQYYDITEQLLRHLGLALDEYFPADRAAAARTVLDGMAQDVESTVKQRIADRTRLFTQLEDGEQSERLGRQPTAQDKAMAPLQRELVVECPACSTPAMVSGETAGASEPRVGDGDIERDVRVLPTAFRCDVCGLRLNGHAELFHAGLGDEFTVVDTEDPMEFYGIDPRDYVSIDDLVEPDYGND